MSRKYSHQLLRIAVAQICQNLGWHSAQSSSLEVLTDVLEKYLLQLSMASHRYCEHAGRTQPNLDDLGLAFQQMGIEISELEDYVKHVDPVPFAHEVVAFPAPKTSNLGFPSSRSREILQHRKEHIPPHLPCMFPNMKDEIPEDKAAIPAVQDTLELPVKAEPTENGEAEEASAGQKRPVPSSTPEMPPSKRPRFGNSNLPEEAGHSKYEMTCVFMGPNGVLTTRQGVQGRLPEPCLPPPNPRTLSEGSNKENSGKAKDGGSNGKLASSGGIGADGISSHKSEGKKSKKSLHKKSGIRDHGKFLSEGGGSKKSASSKAAAKFLKKLKSSKKSAKLFGHSKLKDLKIPEHLKDSSPEKIKSYLMQASVEHSKKKKEKKSEPLDSDEEIRNLSSPPSREPSPEGDAGKDVGEKKKARMDAIDDSIKAVLLEESSKTSKPKKKKKSLGKSGGEEGKDTDKKKNISGKKEEVKVKRKPGRPPKVHKTPEMAPAVDLKPFISDKYSQDELQVYEFNDSPPDASVKARRPSAADTDGSVAPVATPTPTPSSTKKGKTKSALSGKQTSSGHRLHKKDRAAVVNDDLFAPEIKLEHKSSKDSMQKSKIQPEVKEKNKNDREKSLEMDKNKDKDHKKDKRDKKKEKDRKKKHKEKEKDHGNEKEKPQGEKPKEEHRDSRDSSPSVGASGVKLKIKLGSSTGSASSMMVTGDSNSSVASSPTNRTARESMSPPRTVPKLYISRKGQEEKGKKSAKGVKRNEPKKRKSSPLAVSSKSRSVSPTSNKTSPSPRSTPTPPVPHETAIPPSKSSSKLPLQIKPGKKKKALPSPKPASERKSRTLVKDKSTAKDKKKQERRSLSSLSSASSDSSLSPVTKRSKEKKSPARLARMSSSSPSPEKSPAPLPFQSPAPSPPSRLVGDRSNSRTSSHGSPTPKKSSPSRSVSPHNRRQESVPRSPSPSKPPTPGSTSPVPSPDWNLPMSPAQRHHSPSLVPHSPATSPFRQAPPSPTTHWPPAGSPVPHRTPSPAPRVSPSASISRPASRQVAGTPEPRSLDIPSPTSSSKSSTSATKQSRGVEAETVCVFIDDSGQQVWICPGCKKPDDGSEMVGCDMCDNWYHWPCVGITKEPEEPQWFCPKCLPKTKASSSRGRGRPRGRGRGRGRKKIT
ncbi:transcription initiation factor tfiid subunit 3 [Plakobranchus ocellatus]|uniref:Transcription initiation factor tfiid subunit 3 n=1 Tax=Plakobranchus ocellatus TaxID=259542 RepID=A0AAV4ALG7_9GAST|nr:transcription initiation factor tfiid subunit 3 [Plakobranchus ocellatus]